MSIINPQHIANKNLVKPLTKDSVQQNGIDCSINKLYLINQDGIIHKSGKKVPVYIEVKPNKHGYFKLKKHYSYLADLNEEVKIPSNMCALFISRSTLNRLGCDCKGCVFDSGFKGLINVTLYPHTNIYIEKDSRVGQLIFFEATAASLYNGSYQNQKSISLEAEKA